jgi:hypothetical protein
VCLEPAAGGHNGLHHAAIERPVRLERALGAAGDEEQRLDGESDVNDIRN